MYFKSPGKVLLKPWLSEGPRGEGYLKIEKRWVGGVKTSCGYGYGYHGYLSPAKYIHDKGNKNKDDKHFWRLILSLVQTLFFFCFKLMINQYHIQNKKQKTRKTRYKPQVNLNQNTLNEATCSKGNLCSLSRLAAIGASSLSAKSLHVWRNISCVSGSLARFDIDLLFAIHFPVPSRSKMLQTWFLGKVKVDAKLRDHIAAILTFGTRPRIAESTLHVWTSKLC